MGERGPKPKLSQIKKLEGNPGKRRIEEAVIEAAGECFAPPHLNDDAAECFEAIKRSMPPKVYAEADTFALTAYSTAWAWHKRATHELNNPCTEPLTPGSTGALQPNPWFKILKAMSEEMRAWGDRLGLDPKARAALRVPDASTPKSKFEGLVAIQGGRSGS